MRRGALAGVVAAATWAAAEPLLERLFRTGYKDSRLLGRVVTSGPLWPAAGIGVHLANGAAFGAAFEYLGGRGWKQGLVAAQAENVLLWPGMIVVDRYHPDRTSGRWPRLATSPRVFGQEAAAHAVFGVVLGLLLHD